MVRRTIVHIEIPSDDLERSGSFYQGMFNWRITPMAEMNYATWDPGEGPGGGFAPIGDGTNIGEILIHVASEDISADLQRAAALGGSIVREKTEIPNIGWWGVFKDPAGNAIALFTSLNKQE